MGDAQSVQEGSGSGSVGSDEGVLLSKLIQLLNDRQCLLLSDLGALLPVTLRHRVKEHGGLRSWLQRFPSLFAVTGQPGQESVTLILGATPEDAQAVNVKAQTPLSASAGNLTAEASGGVLGGNGLQSATACGDRLHSAGDSKPPAGEDLRDADEDPSEQSAVQLRGLPFRATNEDVRMFLGEYASQLVGPNGGIQLMTNRDGRPSGFARVQLNSPEAARRCKEELHLKVMEERYVEVFLYSERPSKGRNRRAVVEEGLAGDGDSLPSPDISGVTRESVVTEVREQMQDARKHRVLLSMLGVALSPGARGWLKHHELGLKNFLAQFKGEFFVDGPKGCESVLYQPAQTRLITLEGALDGIVVDEEAPTLSGPTGRTDSGSRANSAARGGRRSGETPPIGSPVPAHRHGDPAHKGVSQTPSPCGTPAPVGAPPAWGMTPECVRGCPGVCPASQQPWMPPATWGGPTGFAGLGFMGGDGSGWAQPPWANPMMSPLWPSGWPDSHWSEDGHDSLAGAGGGSGAPGLRPATDGAGPGTSSGSASIRLRGLPFSSSEQDILAFFATHEVVDRISDGPQAVHILLRTNGKSSGQAIVQMKSRDDANVARHALHGKYMGNRYIEVFLTSDNDMAMGGKGMMDMVSGRAAGQGGVQRNPMEGLHVPGFPPNWGFWGGPRPRGLDGAAGMNMPSEHATEPWEVLLDAVQEPVGGTSGFGGFPHFGGLGASAGGGVSESLPPLDTAQGGDSTSPPPEAC